MRKLFGLRDQSLIGRKLDDVFPSESASTVSPSPSFLHITQGEGATSRKRRPPTILGRDALYSSETHRLKPVYGKPVGSQQGALPVEYTLYSLPQVDIVDNYGSLSTIAIWSYPLTTTAALISQQRKQSAVSCIYGLMPNFPSPFHHILDPDAAALRGRDRES